MMESILAKNHKKNNNNNKNNSNVYAMCAQLKTENIADWAL